MNACERYETDLSAWLDDELERPDQLELFDHLVRCPSCRGFAIRARSLEGLVATVRPPRDAIAPSPAVWSNIRRAVDRPRVASLHPSAAWSAGWRAAAVLIVSVGLGVLLLGNPTGVDARDPGVEIRLGQDAGAMSDSRFMELTTEVLRADPRYQNALYRVMEQVVRDTGAGEASADYGTSDDTGDEPVQAERISRNPA